MDMLLLSLGIRNEEFVVTAIADPFDAGPLTLTIERGYTYAAVLPNPPFQANYTIEATRLTLNYPYRWQFNRVAPLVAPGANYPAVSQINSVAIMQNLN